MYHLHCTRILHYKVFSPSCFCLSYYCIKIVSMFFLSFFHFFSTFYLRAFLFQIWFHFYLFYSFVLFVKHVSYSLKSLRNILPNCYISFSFPFFNQLYSILDKRLYSFVLRSNGVFNNVFDKLISDKTHKNRYDDCSGWEVNSTK